jgi:hypothetical protein
MFLAVLAGSAIMGGVVTGLFTGSIIIGLGMFISLSACYGGWWFSWNR